MPVELTVDRSQLIRFGYVLLAVSALFAAYKILSPKDPFQTVARVVTPWADIARPSRVQISDVQPGDIEVYHGRTVSISAQVTGTREGDPVTLFYTTADGQIVDRPVPLALAAGGLRHECTLPAAEEARGGSSQGVQQDLTYRIVAGDAVSADYKIVVVAAPTIVVQRIEYSYPAYTEKAARTVDQQGDIQALEGTRVTIHALANQPISAAVLEFDPTGKSVGESLPLEFDGDRARGTFVMQLKADRATPWHTSYQVRFVNARQQWSERPTLHQIEVVRDLPPEVQILAPLKQRVEVPENGSQTIEVRAIDPDFALSSLRLQGIVGQREALNQELLEEPAKPLPQVVAKFSFRPAEHKLVAGDEMTYWAVAADNRTSGEGSPEPNTAKTAEYVIRILPPTKSGDPAGKPPTGDDEQPDKGDAGKSPMDKPGDAKNEQPKDADMPPKDGDMTKKDEPTKPGEQKSQKPSDEGKSKQDQQKPGEQSQSGGGQGQSGSEAGAQAGESQPAGGKASKSQAGSPQGGQPMPENSQAGESGTGDTSGQSSGNSTSPSGNEGGETSDPTGPASGKSGRQGKAHEGELVEEVLKQIEKEKAESGANPGQGGKPAGGEKSNDQQDQSPGQGDTKSNGAKGTPQPKPGDAAKDKAGSNPGEGAQGDGTKSTQSPQSGKPQAGKGQDAEGPQPDGAKTDAAKTQAEDGAGQKDKGDKGKESEADPDMKHGEGTGKAQSKTPGGKPQGPDKTDKGEQSKQGSGEKKDPGAGQNGDEGAGNNSTDKTGSGQGQEKNQDRPKEQQPDSTQPKNSETSAPSGSKKQSDSKGATSGDQSGGGSKGAGQSAGQEGHDSAGSKSAADEGAGAANQKGDGETGTGAGDKKAASKATGESGKEKGDGSSSRSDPMGSEAGKSDGPSSPEQPKDDRSPKANPNDSTGSKGQPGAGPIAGGGVEGNRPQVDYGPGGEVADGEKANLEYSRKATDMVLNRLRDEEQNPNPELLDRLGWTKDDLQEFLRRWDALQNSAEQNPQAARELDESLRSLGLKDPRSRTRTGGAATDIQRDLRDSGTRTAPPSKYRDSFDAFRKRGR